jgi:hypothetical protein
MAKLVEMDDNELAIVSANNHYAGFGPETANIFRKMMGLSEATWRKALSCILISSSSTSFVDILAESSLSILSPSTFVAKLNQPTGAIFAG